MTEQGQLGLFDTNEEWRGIAVANGKYQVSDLGHVRNAETGALLSLRPASKDGYLYVALCHRFLAVSRLVYQAFMGDISSDMDVHHKDGDHLNNALSNLEAISRADHIEQSKLQIPRGESHYNSKITEQDVRDIRRKYSQFNYRLAINGQRRACTLHSLAAEYGVHFTTIHAIIHRKSWAHITD